MLDSIDCWLQQTQLVAELVTLGRRGRATPTSGTGMFCDISFQRLLFQNWPPCISTFSQKLVFSESEVLCSSAGKENAALAE